MWIVRLSEPRGEREKNRIGMVGRRSEEALCVRRLLRCLVPELIEAACAKASLPLAEAAPAFKASRVGKLTSDMR
jgi:hypothetical protein